MTNSPVKSMGSFPNQPGASLKSSLANSKGNFGTIFGQTYNQTEQNKLLFAEKNQVSKTAPVRTDLKGNNAAQTTTAGKTEDVNQSGIQEEKLKGTGEDLVEEVAKELGMSVEEVVKAMETLGIMPLDLLNPDSMTQLFMNLADTDMLTVLTNDSQYQSLQNLLGFAEGQFSQLQNELGLAPDELQALIDQMQVPETEEQVPEAEIAQPKAENTKLEENGNIESNNEASEVPEEIVKPVSTEKNEGAVKNEAETAEVNPENVSEVKNHSQQNENGSERQTKSDQEPRIHVLTESPVLNEVRAENPVTFEDVMGARAGDTREIARQIMDYMRVQIKTDVTQMQIQLNPASLGTVNINITAKEGVITAQFLAQNEAVKAVIESQIVQLKNTFEEQGLKVEAVEVAVESHSFDRSPGQPGFGQSEQEQQSRKSSPRRLNLNELNLDEEAELDETEQLAVEMMQASGSTVDFTA